MALSSYWVLIGTFVYEKCSSRLYISIQKGTSLHSLVKKPPVSLPSISFVTS